MKGRGGRQIDLPPEKNTLKKARLIRVKEKEARGLLSTLARVKIPFLSSLPLMNTLF